MNDVLDLDALAPQPKNIKINGKVIQCHPPTLKQLIALERTAEKLKNSTNAEEAIKELEDVLSAVIPALKEDSEIDLSVSQFFALIDFLQKEAIPQGAKHAENYPVQKKNRFSRAVGYFLYYYPGYKIDDVLNEYAIRFYLFLDHALRIEAENRLTELTIASYPYMDKSGQTKVRNNYNQLVNPQKVSTIQEDRERLRKVLSKK